MRRLEQPDGDGTAAGPLRFLAYSWGEVRGASDNSADDELPWSSQSAFLSMLPLWGLSPVPALAVSEDSRVLLAAHAELAEKRGSLGYHVDGVVYKVRALLVDVRSVEQLETYQHRPSPVPTIVLKRFYFK